MPPKYKPGGKRFPPRASSKPLPKQVLNEVPPAAPSSSASVPTSSGLSEEAENQFELELCWCIQQLQSDMHGEELSVKQRLDTSKILSLLESDTVALIKKRQIMRNTFGDYRSKMAQDEKKHGKYLSKAKLSTPNANTTKFVFLKKAGDVSGEQNTPDKDSDDSTTSEEPTNKKSFVMSKEPSDVPFTFNFSEPESK